MQTVHEENNDMMAQMADLVNNENSGGDSLDPVTMARMLKIQQSDEFIQMKKQMMREYTDDLLDEAMFTYMLRPQEFYINEREGADMGDSSSEEDDFTR